MVILQKKFHRLAFLVSLVDLTIPQEERKSSCGIVFL